VDAPAPTTPSTTDDHSVDDPHHDQSVDAPATTRDLLRNELLPMDVVDETTDRARERVKNPFAGMSSPRGDVAIKLAKSPPGALTPTR
jgi:hypothetical protein